MKFYWKGIMRLRRWLTMYFIVSPVPASIFRMRNFSTSGFTLDKVRFRNSSRSNVRDRDKGQFLYKSSTFALFILFAKTSCSASFLPVR